MIPQRIGLPTQDEQPKRQMYRLRLAARRWAAKYQMRQCRSKAVDHYVDRSLAWIETAFDLLGVTAMTNLKQNSGCLTRSAFSAFIASCAVVIFGWGTVVYLGWNDWSEDGLAARGQFGDSFGVLSALFAGLAFIGAATAAFLQRQQLIAQHVEMQHAESANSVATFEARFFQLLKSLETAVNETRVDKYVGRQAIRKLAERLTKHQIQYRQKLGAGAGLSHKYRREDINVWFTVFYEGVHNGTEIGEPAGDLLGHVFRLIYHILRYLYETQFVDREEKQFFVRILRAHLSNPELVLIFYNGLSDYGYPKLYELLEEFDLLQNINRSSLPDVDDKLLYKRLAD